MSEKLEFHPEIEKAIETSGDDIGRVKDVELAHDAAESANFVRAKKDPNFKDYEDYTSRKRREDIGDDRIKRTIAERAVGNQLWDSVNGIADQAMTGKDIDDAELERRAVAQFRAAGDEAKKAVQDYDSVAQAAYRQRNARLNKK